MVIRITWRFWSSQNVQDIQIFFLFWIHCVGLNNYFCLQMSWTPIPVFFAEVVLMNMTQAQTWCNQNVPSTDIKTFDELVPALAHTLGIVENKL